MRGPAKDVARVEVMPGLPHTKFQADDVIYVLAEARAADEFIASQALVELPAELETVTDVVREMGVAKVMLAPNSDLLGKTLREAGLQSRSKCWRFYTAESRWKATCAT